MSSALRALALKEALWALAGLVVSWQIITSGRFSLFGTPLLFLSILLGALALWHAFCGKR